MQDNIDDLKTKAGAGNPDAMARLGVMYELGCGVPQDYKVAKKYYEDAAEQGNELAKCNLQLFSYGSVKTVIGPFSFRWGPNGYLEGNLRSVPENMFQLALQLVRNGQIKVAEDLVKNNSSVKFTVYVNLSDRYEINEVAIPSTLCGMACHAEDPKNRNNQDTPTSYTYDVDKKFVLKKEDSIPDQIYICAAYIYYLQQCDLQIIIDMDRDWYHTNQYFLGQQDVGKFEFTLSNNLFFDEPDDVFELAEKLQEQNYVSLWKVTVPNKNYNHMECYYIDYVSAVNCLPEQIAELEEKLKNNLIKHINRMISIINTATGFNYNTDTNRHIVLAAYIDYLRETGQYGDYTRTRKQHQKETVAQFESSTTENPDLEKVLAIAENEANSSLYCIIEANRGAGQEKIVDQIASVLSLNGKLERADAVQTPFFNADFNGVETLPQNKLLTFTNLHEFLYRAKSATPSDGSQTTHMIDILGRYTPHTFVIILADADTVSDFLDLSPQINFLFGENIIPIQNMSAEKMYEVFKEGLTDDLKIQLEETDDFENKFLDYIAVNQDRLPLVNEELADYLSAYACNQKKLDVPPYENRTQSTEEMLDAVIGMDNVKKKAYEFEKYALFQKRAEMNGMKLPKSHLHMVFTGNPGTGKTMIARIMAKILYSIGIVKTDHCFEVERKDLVAEYVGQTAVKTSSVIEKALDGVLFIDEAYTLASHSDNDFGAEAIATLLKAMEDYRDRLVIIFAGYEKEMHDFLTANPGLLSRTGYTFRFEDYSADELVHMFDLKMTEAGFEYSKEEFMPPIKELCEHFSEQKDFGNGRFVDQLMQRVIISHSQRALTNENISQLIPDDIPSIKEMSSTDEQGVKDYREQLDEFVGMENVKRKIQGFAQLVEFQQKAKKEGAKIPGENLHMIFTGNPGTGKTTIARIMSDMLFSIGIIPTHKFIEVERKDLIAEYVGQTAIKTGAVIDRAMGGILFIDEAYTLTPHAANDFGAEAIATLIKAMEDNKNNLIVIFAGYKEEMREFKDANPGIASRIGYTFDFDDYSPEELLEIFLKKMEPAKFSVGEDAKEKILILLDYFTKQKDFGNGRFVDRLIQETIIKHAEVLEDDTDLLSIHAKDIPEITELTDNNGLASTSDGMESVIGMNSVKERLDELERLVQFEVKARDSGLTVPDFNMHMLFTGNPGTGKTMVARIIAQRLYDIGVIKTNNFVEVERKDLVAEYIGQTAVKTAEVIERAMGGILFIDEAYALAMPDSAQDFGAEAIATLIKAMEDHKDNLIVIFAGYKNEMERFLNSNPGIASRIGFTFEFEDYTPEELQQIFIKKMSSDGFSVEEAAKEKLITLMQHFVKTDNFGNGRFVDQVVQKTFLLHARSDSNEASVEIITVDDIPSVEEMQKNLAL